MNDDIIDTIFDACQSDPATQGLTLEDVQREECVAAVDEIVGESNGAIDYLFEAADANGDGIVIRSEVTDAFDSLAVLRSNPPCEKRWKRGENKERYHCSYRNTVLADPTCCSCWGCKCPDKC